MVSVPSAEMSTCSCHPEHNAVIRNPYDCRWFLDLQDNYALYLEKLRKFV